MQKFLKAGKAAAANDPMLEDSLASVPRNSNETAEFGGTQTESLNCREESEYGYDDGERSKFARLDPASRTQNNFLSIPDGQPQP